MQMYFYTYDISVCCDCEFSKKWKGNLFSHSQQNDLFSIDVKAANNKRVIFVKLINQPKLINYFSSLVSTISTSWIYEK